MMRGGKDEEKMVSPMFPRLHINDSDKGGPRAPPRNKMALYEQLSIPTQRIDSGSLSSSVLPLPPNKGSSLVPSVYSNHAGSHERNFRNPCGDSLREKHLPRPHGTFRPSPLTPGQEHISLNVAKDEGLRVPQPLSSGPKDRSFKSSFSDFKNYSWKRTKEKSDFLVPSYLQAGAAINHNRIRHIQDFDNQPRLSLPSSLQLHHASDEPKKRNSAVVPKAMALSEARSKEKENQTIKESPQLSTSVASERSKRSIDASLALPALLEEAHMSLKQQNKSHSSEVSKSFLDVKARASQSAFAMRNRDVSEVQLLVDPPLISRKSSVSMRIELSSGPSLKNDDKISPNGYQDDVHSSLQAKDSKRSDTILKKSLGQSVSVLEITPDDVVRALGEKQFWKARQAIVGQQRVFVLQVFELHKLIKVQKLIAALPDALLEGNLYLGKPSSKVPSLKRLSSELLHNKEPLLVGQLKDLSPKRLCSKETAHKNAVGKLLFPSIHSEASKVIAPPQSNHGLHSENAPPAPSPNIRQSPSCYPVMGSQWLVPVMSPSEGLVYKPYSGPCPLPGSFLAPTYGSCNPMNPSAGSADFLNTGYGVPAPDQLGMGVLPAVGQAYFPPYGMQANQLSSGSIVEQMSSLNGPLHKDIQFLVGDNFPNRSASNLSSQASRVIRQSVGRFQSSKETEKQGSSASSPIGGATADALTLFPVEPTVKSSDHNDQDREPPKRVIKVVPHNPRTAVESAARIFRSIQMERQQCDLNMNFM